MTKIFFVLVCFTFLKLHFALPTVICDSKRDIVLHYGDFVFIESPNFPKSMNETHKKECIIDVAVEDDTKMDVYLLLSFPNGYVQNVELSYVNGDRLTTKRLYSASIQSEYINATKLTFRFFNFTVTCWNAFQAYVTYDYHNNPCPLAFAKPTIFTNDSQIIEIRSRYANLCPTVGMQICKWVFRGLENYGFKFFLSNFDAKKTNLLVTNSTDYVITDGHFIKQNQVFYNGDNTLIVNYQGLSTCNHSQPYEYDYFFVARISVVKNSWTEKDADCSITQNGSTVIWTTKNLTFNGYQNNAQCNYSFIVQNGTQVVVKVMKLMVENDVDILEYQENKGNWNRVDLKVSSYTFKPNNYLPNIWRFKSDGSIQGNGFKVQFETLPLKTIKCECRKDIVMGSCESEREYSITGDSSFLICSNLKCNITIHPNINCSNQRFSMSTYRTLICADFINFYIYSNDKIMVNSSHINYNYETKFLLPFDKNATFVFDSKEVIDDCIFYFKLVPVNEPKINKIILTPENPSYAIETVYINENTILKVELNDELISNNEKLEMYTTFEDGDILINLLLMDGEEMTEILSPIVDLYNNDYLKYATSYTSFKNNITIYKPIKSPNDYAVLYFRAKSAQSSNCLFKKTVFNIGTIRPLNNLDRVISMQALPTGPCEVILFYQPFSSIGLQDFWIHGNHKTNKFVVLYEGVNEKKQVMNFSENEIKPWKNMVLGSMFYTFVIPPDTRLIVTMLEAYKIRKCFFDADLFNSFIDTPYYGYSNTHRYQKKEIAFYEICAPVVFIVKTLDVSENGRLWFQANNETIQITKIGQRETFENTSLSIYFYEIDLGHTGSRIFITNTE